MPILALFIATFLVTFLVYRRKGQKVADCVHKSFVAAIVLCVVAFGVVTGLSYI